MNQHLLLCGLFILAAGVGGLKDVALNVPELVSPGDTVKLQCSYDMEGDPLYSVKWYKGRKEFFRYLPKELPHTRVFPLPGVNVDVSRSGANQVVLQDVQMELAGKYRCEVSADAPTFDTGMVGKYMHVAHLPEGEPQLMVEKQRYSVGETLRANCTSPASNPAANLTWFINGSEVVDFKLSPIGSTLRQVGTSYTFIQTSLRLLMEGKRTLVNKNYQQMLREYTDQPRRRWVTVILLEEEIDGGMFQYGKMRLQCVATMYDLYRSGSDVQLEEEKPRLASVLGTRESSLGTATRYQRGYWILPALYLLQFLTR